MPNKYNFYTPQLPLAVNVRPRGTPLLDPLKI